MGISISYLGKENKELEKDVNALVKDNLLNNIYNEDEIASVSNYPVKILEKDAKISDRSLEYIRFLCQRYDNEIKPTNLVSHRKYIGRFITLAKKIIFRCVNFALRNYINQQKEFNAGVLKSIISLHNKK